jgi:hypothetical protein
MAGRPVFSGATAAAATSLVALDVACADPAAFVAVT